MNTLVCTAPGQFAYQEAQKPALSTGNALVKIRRIGICGTDLHAFEGTQPFFNYPRILGHELAGDLVDADGAPDFAVGEAVTFIPYFNCGYCIACRSGKPNCCVRLQVAGVHIDGGMVEYLSVPAYSLVHGQGLSHDELALVEPLAIGAHGIRRADVQPGEFVLVVGAGPIGLGVMEFARIAGATVIALDINENRLRFCKTRLGVTHTVNAQASDVAEQLAAITNGDMPTVVIDATGSLRAINTAFSYLAHSGRYVLVGLQKGEISFSHPEFHKREATLMSSRNATRSDFEHVIASMKQGLVEPTTYITHRVAFGEVQAEFEHWLDPANGVIKAMVAVE
ncbi:MULTISPECIES: zinc-binding alcohol dehydrogenase family protein [Spirosoma]|uniref:Zinc-binding alcohol dehydrogenase family protein n=1 Tax=Spirosoma liriopis TaxID=2937440 RepID=A0ABT0HHP7_9BACT|nr:MULTISPECIES: zinc-binding alcohol dehydrogenase family protein [Spirosoma]MCK8491685.1 zinc-binding alcohol dehydrogenase family protein [Spirosoma liriopis]UHG91046.1 zinc-binding alcohol dehydrogenase family protein [Spirosoma oryzicola]